MRKIIAALVVSVDGFIEGPNGELDWVDTWEDPFDLLPQIDTCILGPRDVSRLRAVLGCHPGQPRGHPALHRQGRDEGRDRLRTLRGKNAPYRPIEDVGQGRLEEHADRSRRRRDPAT